MRSFNQARHIADGESEEIGIFHNANLRMQRGKGVRGNLRARFRDRGKERRFSRVRKADQTDLGHNPQFEQVMAFVSRFARLSESRGLSRRRGEVAIAQTAASAFAEDETL